MKYINKIMKPIVTLISNIKYLFMVNMSELNKSQLETKSMLFDRVNKIYDNIDIDNIEDKIYDMESTLGDKVDQYEVQDILHDTFGYSEDYASEDDLNDVKEVINNIINDVKDDIKEINKHLKTDIDDVNIDLFYDRYHNEIVLKVIEEIIFKLGNNENV